jgi:hypothetical protein
MPTYTFVAYVEIPITADTLDEAVLKFNDLTFADSACAGVKEIRDENGVPIDRPLKAGKDPIKY